jgi:hypothetical protein
MSTSSLCGARCCSRVPPAGPGPLPSGRCSCARSLPPATGLVPMLDVQGPGLTLAAGGVGLAGLGAGTRSLRVTIGGPVQTAVLYWAGRDIPCPLAGGPARSRRRPTRTRCSPLTVSPSPAAW